MDGHQQYDTHDDIELKALPPPSALAAATRPFGHTNNPHSGNPGHGGRRRSSASSMGMGMGMNDASPALLAVPETDILTARTLMDDADHKRRSSFDNNNTGASGDGMGDAIGGNHVRRASMDGSDAVEDDLDAGMREFAHRGTMSHRTMQRLLSGEPDEEVEERLAATHDGDGGDGNGDHTDSKQPTGTAIGMGGVSRQGTRAIHTLRTHGSSGVHTSDDEEKPMGHADDDDDEDDDNHNHNNDNDGNDNDGHDKDHTRTATAAITPGSRPLSRLPSRAAVGSKSKTIAAHTTSSGVTGTGTGTGTGTSAPDGSPSTGGKASRSRSKLTGANASSRKPGWGRARSKPVLRMATSHLNLADLAQPLQFAVPPEHHIRMGMSMMRLFAIMWYWIASPLRLSLDGDHDLDDASSFDGTLVVDYIWDVYFIGDLIANLMFFNTHDGATGDLCASRRQIAVNYLNSDRFVWGIVAILPFDLFGLAVSWRAVYWLRMSRLLHMICAFDAPHFEFDAWRSLPNKMIRNIATWFTDSAVRRLVQLVFLIALFVHILSCLWILVSRSDLNGPGGIKQLKVNETSNELYLDAFYFTVSTMFLVGFGDITPKYTGEVAYTILMVFIGFTLCAGIVANLVPLYAHHSFVRQKYENQMEQLLSLMRFHGTPPEERDRIVDYYHFIWRRQHGVEEQRLLTEDLPRRYRIEACLEICGHVLETVPFLWQSPNGLLRSLVAGMTSSTYCPGDTILHRGQLNDRLHLLISGQVYEVADESGVALRTLVKGSFFGDECFAWPKRTCESSFVVADEYADVFSIARDYYEQVARAYPNYTLKHIQRVALAAKTDAALQVRQAQRRASRAVNASMAMGGHNGTLAGGGNGGSGGGGGSFGNPTNNNTGNGMSGHMWSNDRPVIRPTKHRKSLSGTDGQLDLAALAVAAHNANMNNNNNNNSNSDVAMPLPLTFHASSTMMMAAPHLNNTTFGFTNGTPFGANNNTTMGGIGGTMGAFGNKNNYNNANGGGTTFTVGVVPTPVSQQRNLQTPTPTSPFMAAVRRLSGPVPLAVIPVGLEAAPSGLAIPEGSPIIFYHSIWRWLWDAASLLFVLFYYISIPFRCAFLSDSNDIGIRHRHRAHHQ